VSPSGSLFLSANQNGDCVSVFRRDPDTGRLTDTGKPIAIGTPMCLKMVKVG
jgi:6-phosphogluconolactonase